MKLKLEVDEDITILSVTEDIEQKHFAVLKAGLKKIFISNKKVVVLNLSAVPENFVRIPAVAQEAQQLAAWAKESGATILVVSAVNALGGVGTLAEALKTLKAPLARLHQREIALELEMRTLEAQKAELLKKIDALAGKGDLKSLRRDQSDFKRAVAMLEENINRYLKNRANPVEPAAMRSKVETVRTLLITVLEQEGALPIRAK